MNLSSKSVSATSAFADTSNIDYTQILPIQQKRTIAFVNSFVVNTVHFLNQFAQSCESRLMQFEYKLQKIDASLIILESQLESIPGLDKLKQTKQNQATPVENASSDSAPNVIQTVAVETFNDNAHPTESTETESNTIELDENYKRFQRMIHVGVPIAAVKLKMQVEGFDPNVLHSISTSATKK